MTNTQTVQGLVSVVFLYNQQLRIYINPNQQMRRSQPTFIR